MKTCWSNRSVQVLIKKFCWINFLQENSSTYLCEEKSNVANPFWVSLCKVGISHKTLITTWHGTNGIWHCYRDVQTSTMTIINQSEELISDLLFCSCMPHRDRQCASISVRLLPHQWLTFIHPQIEVIFSILWITTHIQHLLYIIRNISLLPNLGNLKFSFKEHCPYIVHILIAICPQVAVESRAGILQSLVQGLWSSVFLSIPLFIVTVGFR